jgi:hypothetical protein
MNRSTLDDGQTFIASPGELAPHSAMCGGLAGWPVPPRRCEQTAMGRLPLIVAIHAPGRPANDLNM